MGQVLQAGVGQAPARQAALQGRPPGHDLAPRRSTASAARGSRRSCWPPPRSGPATPRSSVAGGMESMNGAPYLAARRPVRLPPRQRRADRRDRPRRPVVRDRGLPHGHPRRAGRDQATTSAAPTRTPSRSPSHQKAIAAIDAGRFDAEMAPVTVRDAKGRETVVAVDEGPRRDSTHRGAGAAQARLRPARAARTAATRRRARSRPATRRASPTAPRRPSSPANGPSSGSA